MNVILLAPTPPPQGGIASWTKRMMQANLKNDWHVVVVDEKVTGNRDAYNGSKKDYYDEIKRCLRIWKDLNKSLANAESRVVQACIPAGTTSMLREIFSAIITKLHKRKFITHFRCTIPNMVESQIAKFVFRVLVALSDCVFVLNSASADYLKSINPHKKYEIIPNFIENEFIYSNKQYNEKLRSLLYVGGVITEKGCDMIAKIAEAFPEKNFILIGNIDIDINIFPSNTILLGEKSKEFIQHELKKADAFLFLSRYKGEGFSNALAEAMSHAVPCIVSDWAANADMIENKGGIVLEKYDICCAVNAIKSIENVNIRKEMGKWNVNKVITSYSDTVVTDMYINAYEKLL